MILLLDNTQPELSIYYNGALIIKELKKEDQQSIVSLYGNVKSINNMSLSTFILCLDWLYLIEMAKVNEKGIIELCL